MNAGRKPRSPAEELILSILLEPEARSREAAQQLGLSASDRPLLQAHVVRAFAALTEASEQFERGEALPTWSGQVAGLALSNDALLYAIAPVRYEREARAQQPLHLYFAYDRPQAVRVGKFEQVALGVPDILPGLL